MNRCAPDTPCRITRHMLRESYISETVRKSLLLHNVMTSGIRSKYRLANTTKSKQAIRSVICVKELLKIQADKPLQDHHGKQQSWQYAM